MPIFIEPLDLKIIISIRNLSLGIDYHNRSKGRIN